MLILLIIVFLLIVSATLFLICRKRKKGKIVYAISMGIFLFLFLRYQRESGILKNFSDYTEHNRLAETSYHIHEFVVTRLGIGKAHGLADNTPILSDYGRLVVTLGNVNTDEQHRKHLEKSSCGQSSERSGSKPTRKCEDSRNAATSGS